jgi:hypothetical protein
MRAVQGGRANQQSAPCESPEYLGHPAALRDMSTQGASFLLLLSLGILAACEPTHSKGERDASQDEVDADAPDADNRDADHPDADDPDAGEADDSGEHDSATPEDQDAACMNPWGDAGPIESSTVSVEAVFNEAATVTTRATIVAGPTSVSAASRESVQLETSEPVRVTFPRSRTSSAGRPTEFATEVVVLAPPSGDALRLAAPYRHESRPIYDLSPVGCGSAECVVHRYFAGDLGCAFTTPSRSLGLTEGSDCSIEAGSELVGVRLMNNTAIAMARTTLPAPVQTSQPVTVGPWTDTTTRTLSVVDAPVDTLGWIRSRTANITALVAAARPIEGEQLLFGVVPELADSFDVELRSWSPSVEGRILQTLHTNVPATSTPTIRYEPLLPVVTSVSLPSSRCGRGARLSWTVDTQPVSADAVVIVYALASSTSCCGMLASVTVVAPPETLSIPIGFLGTPPQIGGPRDYALQSITYVDADHQHGYRDFLRETLRPQDPASHAERGALEPSPFGPALKRQLPIGGRVRATSYVAEPSLDLPPPRPAFTSP